MCNLVMFLICFRSCLEIYDINVAFAGKVAFEDIIIKSWFQIWRNM